MRWKTRSKRVRWAVGISDLIPVWAVLPEENELRDEEGVFLECKTEVNGGFVNESRGNAAEQPDECENENIARTEKIVREILKAYEGTVVSLEAQVMLYIGEEFIPEKESVARKGALAKEGTVVKMGVVS